LAKEYADVDDLARAVVALEPNCFRFVKCLGWKNRGEGQVMQSGSTGHARYFGVMQ
jgi:hypothetical protein